ncbi:MAG: PKD domain-containing protein [Candidatus Thermoplasmatota archaeon]
MLSSIGIAQCFYNVSSTPPEIVITIMPKTGEAPCLIYCIGTLSPSKYQPARYYWDFGDGATSCEQNPVHRYETPGEYIITLTITDTTRKTYSYQEKIIVQPPQNIPPVVQAHADKTQGTAPLTVSFTGCGTDPDGSIITYSWNFDDGTTSQEQNPIHQFEKPGTYSVIFSVTDSGGQQRSTTLLITVHETTDTFTPTSFVPWIINTIGRIQLQNRDLGDLEGSYDLLKNRAEKTQTIINEALDDLKRFQLTETYQELKQEVQTCLESFKQYTYYIYKAAGAMLKKEYTDADYYFNLAATYKTKAVESILKISQLIE